LKIFHRAAKKKGDRSKSGGFAPFFNGRGAGKIRDNALFRGGSFRFFTMILKPLSKLFLRYKKARESGMMVIDKKPKSGDPRHENYISNTWRRSSPPDRII
jgi:hypothetical protein